MQVQVEKTWIVSSAELYILLYGREMSRLPLFGSMTDYVPDEEDIARAVFSLSKKGVVDRAEDGALIVAEGMKNILDCLVSYQHCVVEYTRDGDVSQRCLYYNDGVVAEITPDSATDNGFRLRLGTANSMIPDIMEIEELSDMPDIDVEQPRVPADMPATEDSAEAFLKDERILLMAEHYDRNAAMPDRRGMVIRENLNKWIITDHMKDRKRAVERYKMKSFLSLYE